MRIRKSGILKHQKRPKLEKAGIKPVPKTELPHQRDYESRLQRMDIRGFLDAKYFSALEKGKKSNVIQTTLWNRGFAHILRALRVSAQKQKSLRGHFRLRIFLLSRKMRGNKPIPLPECLRVYSAIEMYDRHMYEQISKKEFVKREDVELQRRQLGILSEEIELMHGKAYTLRKMMEEGIDSPISISPKTWNNLIDLQDKFLMHHIGTINFGVFYGADRFMYEWMRAHFN